MEYCGVAWMIMDYRRLLWDYYVSWIIMDYGRSCIIPDYRALLWIIMTIMDCNELSRVIMDCYGLSWICTSFVIMDYGLSCTITAYHELLWIIIDYRRLPWILIYHGLPWIIVGYHG